MRRWYLLGAVVLASLAVGCGPGGFGGEGGPGEASGACEIARFDDQPTERLPAGDTYWLPKRLDSVGEGSNSRRCGDWKQVSGPLAANLVDPGSSGGDGTGAGSRLTGGRARVTPTEPGTYSFRMENTNHTVELTVVNALSKPFVNYPYFGSRSQAMVDGELWVANVYRPTVSRLNPSNLDKMGEVQTGPYPVAIDWTESMDHAVVAQRANDTLGFIDVESGQLVDAVWVGDEPANVKVTSDGSLAYVALAGEGKVVAVDTQARRVTRLIEVNRDPLALALSPDDETLYVATHRSGAPLRERNRDAERDIVSVDLSGEDRTLEATDFAKSVGTTLNAMMVSADGETLYLAGRTNETEPNLANPDEPNFFHRVFALSTETGEVERSVDLTRQESSGGYAVAAHGMTMAAGYLWVTAESSNALLALDPETLAEQGRATTPGRPRSVVAGPDGDRVFVHGAQNFQVAVVDSDFAVETAAKVARDRRPGRVAEGQRYFTGAGADFAKNWACNSCHGDMLTDTLIWNAGPFEDEVVSKPFFWLEGTDRLGWAGYMSNVRNYSYEVHNNVGRRPTTEQAENLNAFLSSIMPPPAENGLTRPDGSLSAEGEEGKEIFEGKAGCAGCHPGPLMTNKQQFDRGITDGVSDVPSLVGVYRHNVWLKHGEATTLREAVVQAAGYTGTRNQLDETEIDKLTRYLRELTGRDFFVLDAKPARGTDNAAVDRPIELTFSRPVWQQKLNLQKIDLNNADNKQVPTSVSVSEDGRHVTLTPKVELDYGAEYRVEIEGDFASFEERTVGETSYIGFQTAAEPALEFDGTYRWVVDMPVPDFENNRFDPSQTVETTTELTVSSRASGADVTADFERGLTYETRAVVDGKQLDVPPMPVAIRDSFGDTTGLQGELEDIDGDGVADEASGTLQLSGPGFQVDEISWRLERPEEGGGGCQEGPDGDKINGEPISLTVDDQGRPVVSWKDDGEKALGFYVTEPKAELPMGPGAVTGGEAYWTLQAENFPDGFASPVTYGEVPDGATDSSMTSDAPTGGAELEEGTCYRFSVITEGFKISHLIWEK